MRLLLQPNPHMLLHAGQVWPLAKTSTVCFCHLSWRCQCHPPRGFPPFPPWPSPTATAGTDTTATTRGIHSATQLREVALGDRLQRGSQSRTEECPLAHSRRKRMNIYTRHLRGFSVSAGVSVHPQPCWKASSSPRHDSNHSFASPHFLA